MSSLVLLDNEAVQALAGAEHPKHGRVLSHIQVVAQRKRRSAAVTIAVPTSVRVEAGWDRTSVLWAIANRLRISDEELDGTQANTAASIRSAVDVSVADAHLGAIAQTTSAEKVTVLTSDPDDMVKVAGHRRITVVAI